ncbi:hypothetical protein BJ875DRAFT_453953 [Amylocarpus encephaloides]|uniref:Uncharacterized protein n=1 Tax=Amylocarpus encephaloides TaxID=45428 RepID=A0A9P7YP31_9HELO|nr:hypothetical protein BJ875DRAFT_453953 [Amylocarpus encephaloides]
MANTAPARTTLSRRRTPLLIGTFLVGSAFFIGLKFRAVKQRSEEAKVRTTKDYHVNAGARSGGGV